MASFELSEEADRDLQRIYAYSVRQFGRDQTLTYFNSLETCFGRLAEFPRLGRSVARLRRGYFRFEHGSHVVFYVAIESGIRVVRVLHQRMDPKRYL